MHHYLFLGSLVLPIIGAFVAIRGATIKIRDNMDEYINDLARQGRWNSWAAILTAIGTVLVAWAAWYAETPQSLAGDPTNGINAKEDMELNRACAMQAEHVFTSQGFSLQQGTVMRSGTMETTASLTNHYNKRRGKCLMLLQSTALDTSNHFNSQSFLITDAFEGTTYAEYLDDGDPTRNPRIVTCRITLPDRPQMRCHTLDEWKEAAKPLMEQTTITW